MKMACTILEKKNKQVLIVWEMSNKILPTPRYYYNNFSFKIMTNTKMEIHKSVFKYNCIKEIKYLYNNINTLFSLFKLFFFF